MVKQSDEPKGNKILIVEDSPTQALHLHTLLESVGLEPSIAETGKEALEKSVENIPDLIILDVQLPDMNGFQIMKNLKLDYRTKDTPIIILSKHSGREEIALGLEIGVVEYIPKDVFADVVLLEVLRNMNFIKSVSTKSTDMALPSEKAAN